MKITMDDTLLVSDPITWEMIENTAGVPAYSQVVSAVLSGYFSGGLGLGCDEIGDATSELSVRIPQVTLHPAQNEQDILFQLKDILVTFDRTIVNNQVDGKITYTLEQMSVNDESFGPIHMTNEIERFNYHELCEAQEVLMYLFEDYGEFAWVMLLWGLDGFIYDVVLPILGEDSRLAYDIDLMTPYGEADVRFVAKLSDLAMHANWLDALLISLDVSVAAELLEFLQANLDVNGLLGMDALIEKGVWVIQDQTYQFNVEIADGAAIINNDEANPVLLNNSEINLALVRP